MKTVILALLLVPEVFGLDITSLDGKNYRDCRVSRVFPDSVCVLWSEGGARIKFVNLPESVRARFGYDPEKAAVFERAETSRKEHERATLEAQRQALELQNRLVTASQNQPPGSPSPGTGSHYVGVNLAAGAANGYNQGGNQFNQFGSGAVRGSAQYVGVLLAPPGGAPIYGLGYGPNTRARP